MLPVVCSFVRKRLLLLGCLLCWAASGEAWGQGAVLRGRVLDGDGNEPLTGAVVKALLARDTAAPASGTVTDTGGYFTLPNLPPAAYQIQVSYTGYARLSRAVALGDHNVTIGPLRLQPLTNNLYAVVVEAVAVRAQQRGDTLEFDAGSYKTHPDATTEDLVAKMPGVTTDNGAIKINGVEVKRILVDGKPFFGDDLKAALRNLPADVISKVQVLDQQSDQARFTGFRDGATLKTINLVTRNGANLGTFGSGQAGYGTDDRYLAGASINSFKNSRRVSVTGLFNNTNIQNFSVEAPAGTTGSGGRGITTTRSGGLNYSDEWGPHLRATASYSGSSSDNTATTNLTRWYLTPSATQNTLTYREVSAIRTLSVNHRANLRLEYKPNEANEVIFTPYASLQNSSNRRNQQGASSWDNGLTDSRSESGSTTDNTSRNLGGELLYRHAFRKTGRSLSLSLVGSLNQSEGSGALSTYSAQAQSDTLFNSQRSVQQSAGSNISSNISYTEPLTRRSQLLVTYQPSRNRSAIDRYVYNRTSDGRDSFLNPGLTNVYQSTYQIQRGGVGYRYYDSLWDFNATVNTQTVQLTGAQELPDPFSVSGTFNTVLPQVQASYHLSRTAYFSAGYTTTTNTPQISQLQSGASNSNPLMLRVGNPNLRQDYTHAVAFSYNRTLTKTGRAFFVSANAALINDYIANTTYTALADTSIGGVLLLRGSQISRPLNLDGAWNARGNATFSLPWRTLKSNLNLTTGLNVNRVPGLVNGLQNTTDNYGLSAGWVLSSNTRNGLDVTASMQGQYTLTRNSLPGQPSSAVYNQNTSLRLNWIFRSRVVLNTAVVNTWYSGLGGYDRTYTLWNASLGYKLLKSRALQADLFAYDLLRQAQSVSRQVTDSYIEDSEAPVLQRYFQFRLTYRIRPAGSR